MKRVLILLTGLFVVALLAYAVTTHRELQRTANQLLEARKDAALLKVERDALARRVEERPVAASPDISPAPVVLPDRAEVRPETGEALSMTTTSMAAQAGGPPPITEAMAGAIDRFDVAMNREFDRLEEREQTSSDAAETTTIQQIKDSLLALDDLYRRADVAETPDERVAIRQEMQATMGRIIGLSRVDRNERLGKLATDIGYNDPAAVSAFVREIDRIYRETHMDWTKLFNRAPPPAE